MFETRRHTAMVFRLEMKSDFQRALTEQLGVVAEGVETIDQVGRLQALDCRYAQGYLFCRPLDTESMSAYLVKSP